MPIFAAFFACLKIFFHFFLSDIQHFNLFLKIFYEKKLAYLKIVCIFAANKNKKRYANFNHSKV